MILLETMNFYVIHFMGLPKNVLKTGACNFLPSYVAC